MTHQSVVPETELSALASIYALAIRKVEEKERAGGTSAGADDPKGDLDDRADSILHRAG